MEDLLWLDHIQVSYQTIRTMEQQLAYSFLVQQSWLYKAKFGMQTIINMLYLQWRSQPADLVLLCKFSRIHWLWKQLISKEKNNDNDLKFA